MHSPDDYWDLKKVIVSVTNDLSTDQRVDRVCNTLTSMGFSVVLVGRSLPDSLPLHREYKTRRMKLMFRKGPLFYAEYNIRLLFFLVFHQADLLVSNDLDTLTANYVAHKLKSIPIVYDSHEYYTGTPELINRPRVQGIWKFIERSIFPKLSDIFTVNESIAALYNQEYHKHLHVLRNIPKKLTKRPTLNSGDLGFDSKKHLIILQGAGINIQRGAEEAILAMKFVENTILLIIGSGDVIDSLKEMVKTNNLTEKVEFFPKKPYSELINYTSAAEIGLTLDKDTNINYRFSLPNKLFDYIHAGTPVLASPLPEIRKIIDKYKVGITIESHNPEHIASKINYMLENDFKTKLKENLEVAANELNWENEEKILKQVYLKYV
ncbi:MAG TPA: glycosyltransferase [Lentimicrobium sp.]|nr:glycosyltransferase [Lentimicrobium sp.]